MDRSGACQKSPNRNRLNDQVSSDSSVGDGPTGKVADSRRSVQSKGRILVLGNGPRNEWLSDEVGDDGRGKHGLGRFTEGSKGAKMGEKGEEFRVGYVGAKKSTRDGRGRR